MAHAPNAPVRAVSTPFLNRGDVPTHAEADSGGLPNVGAPLAGPSLGQGKPCPLYAEGSLALGSCVPGIITQLVESAHGSKYIIDGLLQALKGRIGLVRTVWIREPRKERPRLITAYPREK